MKLLSPGHGSRQTGNDDGTLFETKFVPNLISPPRGRLISRPMILTLCVPSTLCQVSMRPPEWVTGPAPSRAPSSQVGLDWVSAGPALPGTPALPARYELCSPFRVSCWWTLEQSTRYKSRSLIRENYDKIVTREPGMKRSFDWK